MRSRTLVIAGLASTVLSACATHGVGEGYSTAAPGLTATFTWTSTDGVRGDMTATLSSGERYDGRFFQITGETRIDDIQPLWSGWDRRARWAGWPDQGAWSSMAISYSGKVLANLKSASGAHMRCRFALSRPSSGMSGGGFGQCQRTDGAVVYAEFAPN